MWTINDALSTYNIPYWSNGYFTIGDNGNVAATPTTNGQQIDLHRLAQQLRDNGMTLPVLVRFPDILQQQVHNLCNHFNEAIDAYGYQGDYLAVYPIKVNQQRQVVEGLLASQHQLERKQLGLEAGSKPELLAVLALAGRGSSVIVCNGYKDREYVRLALIGEQLGHKVFIVLEKQSELELVLKEAKAMGITPRLGVRARLASQGSGNWQSSGGVKSKFGLKAHQILAVIARLEAEQMLDSLQLLHFHLGSQLANIRDIQRGLKEAGRFYAELHQLGARIDYLDVGGGLAVDYEGTRSQSACSANYSMREYANNVVWVLGDVCREHNLPHPNLISESGRAMTAHHAVLIADVIGAETQQVGALSSPSADAPIILDNLWRTYQDVLTTTDQRAVVELYHDTMSDLAEVNTMYTFGTLNLQQRAWSEQVHTATCQLIAKQLSFKNRAHRPIIDELNEKLADRLFVNFSLFQSLPDAWGIDQVFPVLPLSGLDRQPERRGVILDITCDSDGIIDQYVDGQGIETTLPLPTFDPADPYHIGIFMVGAYQEILGDLHNLFGDTESVDVRLDDAGNVELGEIQRGNSVRDVLNYVNINADTLLSSYKSLASKLPKPERQAVLAELELGLGGYTYLEDLD
ncbi:biosynthetic arginine decarboxylase [uncultured Ferrimonas sp.]|uniref:biosynthetic arginine decarboxylase n=1 Tax=uncultured Ferrimonas sp. TaxID=432640 RepID=UPI0026091177|nr:biosynthetic arginine decarboxylase [uncultured Ferrimonas sp.]